MTMTPAELAALPTVPTLSAALADAARYADQGPINALDLAVYGTTNPGEHISVITPEHTICWALAIFATARRVSPAVNAEWPDASWDAGRFSNITGDAHRALTAWAGEHSPEELAGAFRETAQETRFVER